MCTNTSEWYLRRDEVENYPKLPGTQRNIGCTPSSVCSKVFNDQVKPILLYATETWGRSSEKDPHIWSKETTHCCTTNSKCSCLHRDL